VRSQSLRSLSGFLQDEGSPLRVHVRFFYVLFHLPLDNPLKQAPPSFESIHSYPAAQ